MSSRDRSATSHVDRWQWLIDWRKAKLLCEQPRERVDTFYCYYDKHSGLEEGYNSLLSQITSAKAQITRNANLQQQIENRK